MHGKFARDMENKDMYNTWRWMRKIFERMHQGFDM